MLYPHCTYTGDKIVETGSSYTLESLAYVGSDWNPYALGPFSWSWTEENIKEYLDANLSTYWQWVFSGGSLPSANLSENEIIQMQLDVDGSWAVINFTQSDCVELPLLNSGTWTWSGEFMSYQDMFDISTVEIWASWFALLMLTIYLILFKGILWKK